jgi:formylglycine-generating enzyme required for sulfatase activity
MFDKSRCNTLESEIKMTTAVTRYNEGVSPYGVYDLAGNVWEWCLNARPDEQREDDRRLVHGGSHVSRYQRSHIGAHFYLPPEARYASIGFRLVQIKQV